MKTMLIWRSACSDGDAARYEALPPFRNGSGHFAGPAAVTVRPCRTWLTSPAVISTETPTYKKPGMQANSEQGSKGP